jgi:AcrR family transcriptional regulator
VTTHDTHARATRLPRTARRTQLLGAAREVFAAQGYHAAAMDEIAERAGVSKPVLYQHFPGKRDLYLAVLDEHSQQLVTAIREALISTTDNKQRVAATLAAYFSFIDSESEAFRLIFESDLTTDREVRGLIDRTTRECSALFAEVISEDTGLARPEAELLAVALAGMAQVSARYWLETGRAVPRATVDNLIAQLSWRGVRGFPKNDGPARPRGDGAPDPGLRPEVG